MQPITTIKMGLLSALLCLNANTALSQTVNDFPRPTIKKGDIPKPKPSIPKADIPKPQSPATPRVNIPSNNPGIARPERPKPQTTVYSFVSYPYQKPDPNGVTHVAMLNDQQQYRMYHWPIAKAPIDPALLKSGALDTLAAMQPAVETFQINQSEKAFSIKTKKGIELQFPDQAFADGLGNPVVGTITLSVQSFQSKTDFASAQLTSSTSNGDALISGGMLNVEAKSGNANLRIGDGKSYKIIGNGAYEDGFRTFYGVQGEQTTWSTYTSSAQNGPNDNNDPNSKNAKYTLSLLPITRSSNGVAQPLAMRDDDRNIALSNWFFQQAKISKELKKQIKRDGVIFPAQLKINAQGKITDVQLLDTGQAQKSLISPYFAEFRKLLMSAPPVRFLDTLPMPETLTIRFSTLNENFATIKQLPLPPAVAGLAKMATAQDGKWVLESYSTQMVNCDRFAKFSKSDDSITYSVDRAKALVYLNFKDYNALLGPSSTRMENTGYSYTMKQFPVGAKARLIAVVYNDQGQVHLEVADVSEGNYRIEKAQQYPFNQLTIKAAFEMMPMDLFESKK
ncbi:MAG: hypothetical protein K9J29_02765 [Bacteroidia bacterium]|nr:hypothetical protein [Bacteroidia bacterium]